VTLTTAWWSAAVLAQTGFGQAAEAGAPTATQVGSVWDFLIKGGPMMIPIGLCSLVALAVIVERLVTLRRASVIPPGFLEGVRSRFRESPDDPDEAMQYCREDGSPIANIFLAGLKKLGTGAPQRDKAVEEAGARELFNLRKYLRMLSVVAALAPVMGLLGTVFGMIKAFQTVAVSGEALGKTELLARGIYEALITTAAGLMLAIPVLVAFHWLSARIERLLHEMDRITVDFFDEEVLPAIEESRGDPGPRLAGRAVEASERETAAAPA